MGIQVRHIDFVSVPTRDVARARAFYTETLGFPLERETPGGLEVGTGQVTLGIWAPESVGLPFAPNPAGIALRVDDVAAARAVLAAEGVVFETETFDTGVCHMAPFNDPDGNRLLLHARYAPEA